MRGLTAGRTRAEGGQQEWEPGRESKKGNGKKNRLARPARRARKIFGFSRVSPGAGACRGKIFDGCQNPSRNSENIHSSECWVVVVKTFAATTWRWVGERKINTVPKSG